MGLFFNWGLQSINITVNILDIRNEITRKYVISVQGNSLFTILIEVFYYCFCKPDNTNVRHHFEGCFLTIGII